MFGKSEYLARILNVATRQKYRLYTLSTAGLFWISVDVLGLKTVESGDCIVWGGFCAH